ncbi:Os12g0548300, partial [Oryza sativa Japonica Group]
LCTLISKLFSIKFIVVLFCKAWEGNGVVASARKLIGATNPLQAEPGTIRGDLAVQTGRLESNNLSCFNIIISTTSFTF